jgi:hypothetical protein
VKFVPLQWGKYCFDSQAALYVFNLAKFLQHIFPHTNLELQLRVVIHNIRCIFELHPNWVVLQLDVTNAFNSMSRRVIFQELHVVGGDIIQLIPFVCAFYAFVSPLLYNHRNREGDVTIILFAMGIRQSDHLGGNYSL